MSIVLNFNFLLQPQIVPSNYRTTLKQVLDRPSVKAVITDFDVNCNWAKYALAVSCLKREDVLYITGAMDETITTYCENNLLGEYIDILIEKKKLKYFSNLCPSLLQIIT